MPIKLSRNRLTFGLLFRQRMYLLQFSTKEPWLVPKCDENHGRNKDIVLYGFEGVDYDRTGI